MTEPSLTDALADVRHCREALASVRKMIHTDPYIPGPVKHRIRQRIDAALSVTEPGIGYKMISAAVVEGMTRETITLDLAKVVEKHWGPLPWRQQLALWIKQHPFRLRVKLYAGVKPVGEK
jgi:hypothetical protein